MLCTITKFGNPVLRQLGADVTEITPEIQQFCADLVETMHTHRGVGLAAHQVGQAVNIFAVDIQEARFPSTLEFIGETASTHAVRLTKFTPAITKLEGEQVHKVMPMVLINPKVEFSGDVYQAQEGCLSGVQGDYQKVPRYRKVKVSALNPKGQKLEFVASNFLARVIQHEFDHLQGVLYIDRVIKPSVKPASPELV